MTLVSPAIIAGRPELAAVKMHFPRLTALGGLRTAGSADLIGSKTLDQRSHESVVLTMPQGSQAISPVTRAVDLSSNRPPFRGDDISFDPASNPQRPRLTCSPLRRTRSHSSTPSTISVSSAFSTRTVQTRGADFAGEGCFARVAEL